MGFNTWEIEMNSPGGQQSEVHDVTGDASTSPTAETDEQGTRGTKSAPGPHTPVEELVVPVEPHGMHIIKDETDAGGPLVIVSDDPELNPPKVPVEPFPTLGTPQIDPPVK